MRILFDYEAEEIIKDEDSYGCNTTLQECFSDDSDIVIMHLYR